MYKLALLIALFVATHLTAQTNYEKGMHKAFALWENNNIEEAANVFERIAAAEPDNWLPSYYAAEVLILDGFTKLKDTKVLEVQLKRAQNFVNDATAISKNNPEILVMQAILHTVYVASDGANYGMTLAPKISKLYAEAYVLAPENPRVVLNKAEWDMGSAKYFGQDLAPYCKDVEKALELFANFKPETEFHPNWGKERAEQVLATCKQ